MTDPATLAPLAAAFAGVVGGLLYFVALRHAIDAFGGGGLLLPMVLAAARLGAAGAGFAAAAWAGAGPLLGAFLGFLLARRLIVRRVRRGVV